MASQDFSLNVWRLHPKGVRIVPAEKTLIGTANPAGVKFCGPFSKVNALGWWLFPSVDIDILWKGGQEFEEKLLEPWEAIDHDLVKSLVNPISGIDVNKFCPAAGGRSKFTFGAVEDGVVQFWTGCIFETPPGYNLHIRSPINFPHQPFHLMEGILETDWLQYDIWLNLVFEKPGEWVRIRKDGPPIAQITPILRESYEHTWDVSEQIVNRNTPEANRVIDFWLDYNHKKFGMGGPHPLSSSDPTITKNSATYWQVRAEIMGKEKTAMTPKPEAIAAKPLPKQLKIKNRFIKPKG